jgi:MOSC domain-containing protein YiiM
MSGHLVGIYTTAVGGAPMDAHAELFAVAGVGLDGDRYAAKTGTFSDREGGGREVTLIEREAVAAANAKGVTIAEHETRRNLVTEGVDLGALIGKTFAVGDALLYGVRDCPPCGYLQGMTQPGVVAALQGSGLRADIVRDGMLRVGDEIVEVASAVQTA